MSYPVTEDRAFGLLKQHLIAITGMAYYADRDQDLAELIGRRVAMLGLADCAVYYALLADNNAGRTELDVLIAQLTIGETYFFRDREQFNALRDVVLPEILERKQGCKQLRIWSAGCSNGAEPYSLSILLGRELGHRLADWEVSILATDISQPSLAQAKQGTFGEWAFRSTPVELRRECFWEDGEGWTIRPEFKQWVSFAPLNLVETDFQSPPLQNANFDLILCRNVMIYFDRQVARRLIHGFHESLSEGGWFLVGAVENNLEDFNSFHAVSALGATMYQKVKGEAQREPEKTLTALPWPPESARLNMGTLPAPGPEAPARAAGPNIDGLRRLADRGDSNSAIRYCRQLLALDRLNPRVYFYHALLSEQLGNAEEAERSLRQAIYLDRGFLLAHYHLGLTLAKKKDLRAAARSLENVLQLAEEVPGDQPVAEGDGVTVAGLKALTKMHLHREAAG